MIKRQIQRLTAKATHFELTTAGKSSLSFNTSESERDILEIDQQEARLTSSLETLNIVDSAIDKDDQKERLIANTQIDNKLHPLEGSLLFDGLVQVLELIQYPLSELPKTLIEVKGEIVELFENQFSLEDLDKINSKYIESKNQDFNLNMLIWRKTLLEHDKYPLNLNDVCKKSKINQIIEAFEMIRDNRKTGVVTKQNFNQYLINRVKLYNEQLAIEKVLKAFEIKKLIYKKIFKLAKVTELHKWIINQLDFIYGFDEIEDQISFILISLRNIRLLIAMADNFISSFKSLKNNLQKIKNENVKKEINEEIETTRGKIRKILLNFKNNFEFNKPDGALTNLVNVYLILENNQEDNVKLSKLVEDAIVKDYQSMKDNLIESLKTKGQLTPKVMIELCKLISDKFERLFEFSPSFPKETDYEEKNWQYYQLFKNDLFKTKDQFNGLEMLTFCEKLNNELHKFIEYGKDHYGYKYIDQLNQEIIYTIDDSDIGLINTNELVKGYPEKYMTELYEQFKNQIQLAIQCDNFIPVNETFLHSTSAVDFFTSLNQTYEFISKLNFFNTELLEQFGNLVSKITLDYVNEMKRIALDKVIRQQKNELIEDYSSTSFDNNTTKNNPQQPQVNVVEKKKEVSVKDKFINLFKKKKKDEVKPTTTPSTTTEQNVLIKENKKITEYYNEELEEMEDYVPITEEFLIVLNNIQASKLELEELVGRMIELNEDLSFAKKEDEEEIEEEDIDMNNEEDIQLKLKVKEQNENKLSEYSRVEEVVEIIENELVSYISNNFKFPIRRAVKQVLINAKNKIEQQKGVIRPVPKKQVLELLLVETDNLLSEELIDSLLTPALTTLSSSCYTQLFNLILTKILELTINEIIYSFLIPIHNVESGYFLSIEQSFVLEACYDAICLLLQGNDDDEETGISQSVVEKSSRLIKKLFMLYDNSANNLIELYNKYSKYPTLNKSSVLKQHHILSLIKTRNEEEAKKFYSLHRKEADQIRLIQVFELKPLDNSNDKYEELIVSIDCNLNNIPQTIHLTQIHVLMESKVSKRKRMFNLSSIEKLKLKSNILGSSKGLIINIKGKDKPYTVMFEDIKNRTMFVDPLIQQLKLIGNVSVTQSIEEEKEEVKPTTKESKKEVDDQQQQVIDPLQQFSEAYKAKFKITNSKVKLIGRFTCQARDYAGYKGNKEEEKRFVNGELLIFNNGICFHCLSDGINGAHSIKLNYNLIKDIQSITMKNGDQKIKINLLFDYKLSLQKVDLLNECFNTLLKTKENWNNETLNVNPTVLQKYKKSEPNNYFLYQFNLRNLTEDDEELERKVAITSSIKLLGEIYIGNHHICFQSNNPINSTNSYETKVIPLSFVQNIEKNVSNKLLIFTLINDIRIVFVTENEKTLETLYQRLLIKLDTKKRSAQSTFDYSSIMKRPDNKQVNDELLLDSVNKKVENLSLSLSTSTINTLNQQQNKTNTKTNVTNDKPAKTGFFSTFKGLFKKQ